jgi:hypothetical protein
MPIARREAVEYVDTKLLPTLNTVVFASIADGVVKSKMQSLRDLSGIT